VLTVGDQLASTVYMQRPGNRSAIGRRITLESPCGSSEVRGQGRFMICINVVCHQGRMIGLFRSLTALNRTGDSLRSGPPLNLGRGWR
jgi:hypothetical protein